MKVADLLDRSRGVVAVSVRGGKTGRGLPLGPGLTAGTGARLRSVVDDAPPAEGWYVVLHRPGRGPTAWERECAARIWLVNEPPFPLTAPLLGVVIISDTGEHVLAGSAP